MEKMSKLDYVQVQGLNKNSNNETTFSLQPLERGFGNTLGVALRRVLLSNITSIALCAVRIEGVDHEFQVIPGVVEDVTALIMNLRKVKFQYDPKLVSDEEIVKVTLEANQAGEVTSNSLKVENSSIEVLNKSQKIATLSSKGSLHLEMYLRAGRGFVSNEENKKFIANTALFGSKVESSIKKGIFIATDSNFSPILKANYKVNELNTASTKIEEKLEFHLVTDGTIDPKFAVKQACEILVAHFKVLGNVDEIKLNVFVPDNEPVQESEENDYDISSVNFSVRSLNALKKIGISKLSEIAALTEEQLEQTKNLGKKSLDEIKTRLEEYGFELSKGEE